MGKKLAKIFLVVSMVLTIVAGCAGAESAKEETQIAKDHSTNIEFFDAELKGTYGVEETSKESMHMGYLSEYPCETTNTLTLTSKGTYSLQKKLLATAESEAEIASTYVFEGNYELDSKGTVKLQPAEKCTFEESYGTLNGASVLGNVNDKSGDEKSYPNCLEYFNGNYIVRSGNDEAKVEIDSEQGTFEIKGQIEYWRSIWNRNKKETCDYAAQAVVEKYEARPLGEIIFYGASNFRMWDNMEADMAPYSVQNHGVGGSTDEDLMAYQEELLIQFQPKVVFIQTGSNDYTQGQNMADVQANKEKMYQGFLTALPDTEFIIMSGLPLPNRSEYWELTQEVNAFIKEYCEKTDRMTFVDATDIMLTDKGDDSLATGDGRYFNPSIFLEDGIHLTQEGHDLWTPLMIDALKQL